ncbi:MAG: lipopolysaccharide biosynthesis protein, partial [Actinomycetota bacterium]|nr:lipopolysaccharide biosynthesis protein [Actinomycetota bacterium]
AGTGADAAASNRRHRLETILTAASGLGVYGLSLITGVAQGRALGDAGRGTVAAVVVPTQVLGWVLMFGIPQATAYFSRQYARRDMQNSAWVVTAATGIPAIAIIWFLLPSYLDQHPPEIVFWFRLFLIGGLLVTPYTNVIDWLRGTAENVWFNVYRSLPFVVATVLIAALYVAGRLTVESTLAVTLVANVGTWLLTILVERAWPTARLSVPVLKRQLNYGRRVWLGTLSNMVVARFDQFLMVSLVSPAELGHYVIAGTAAGVSAPIAQGVAFALFPYLRDESGDDAASWERTKLAMRWTGLTSVVVAACVGALAPFLLPFAFGEDFRASVVPLLILLPGQVFWNLGNVVSAKLEADDRPGAASQALVLAAVLTLVAVPIVVPAAGIRGAAVVTTCAQASFFVYAWIAAKREPSAKRS